MPLAGLVGVILGMLVIAKMKSSGHGALTGLIAIVVVASVVDADWPLGADWPAITSAIALAFILFGRAAARGWKPGRKD
jgi:glucose dehydrogenase